MEASPRKGLQGRFWALFAALAVGLVVFPASALADVTAWSGGAYGVSATVTTVAGPVSLGPVPMVVTPAAPAGGIAAADLLAADPALALLGISVAGGATVEDVRSQSGNFGTHAGFVTSSTDLAVVSVGGSLSTLLAAFVSADAVSSTCTANGDIVSGSTSIANGLAIIDSGIANGTVALAAAPAPNTVVALTVNNPLDPLGPALVIGSVTLNEQTTVETVGGENTITVNAIHITLLAVPAIGLLGADVIIGQSRCSVTGPDVNVTPSAVQLRSFRASQSKKGVLLRWKTAQEVDSLGFNIYRQVGAKRVKVNRSLISSRGASAGHSYSFLDRSLKKSQRAKVRYWLQEVEIDGSRSWLASARPFRL